MANSLAEMFRAPIDRIMGDAVADYPGCDRVAMMANPVLQNADGRTSDTEWIALRSICGNAIGRGGHRESRDIGEIARELRQLAGDKTIGVQTVVAISREATARALRRAAKTKQLRVCPSQTGMLNTHASQFQREYAVGRIPAVSPTVALQAVWGAPADGPSIPMKYTRSWAGSAMLG